MSNGYSATQLRGIGEEAWKLRPNARIIAGRKFQSGLHEVVVGKGAGASAIPLSLPPFVTVGATTRAGLLPAPIHMAGPSASVFWGAP